MKVLHVVHSLEPGGMENGVVNLARTLVPQGIETRVACLERRGAFADRLPFPDHVVVLGKGHGFSPAAAWRLAQWIARLSPDVVHSHNLGGLIYSSLATLGGRRVPLLQGEHSQLSAADRTPHRLRQRRWLYRGCRAIHTVSQSTRAELLACGFPAGKITAIPNGVDPVHFAPGDRNAARRSFGLPAEALCIGIVGRFGPFKQHRQLIEAFEKIAGEFPAARLLIAGGGGEEEAAVRARVLGSPVCERLHWLGFQSDPRSCYHALDLLLLPSSNEGLSNVTLEAMACGVPVLARAGTGQDEIITPEIDGWIAALETPETLAAKLAGILTRPDGLMDCGRRARKKVQDHFSLDAMTAAYERLYRALASR